MSLWSQFQSHQGRRIRKYAHYFSVYERHFGRFVDRPALLLEIGVSDGGSMSMWKRWLGPSVRIVGVDIDPACTDVEERQVSVRIGSQSDEKFLQSLLDEFGPPDIIVDDGSHVMSDVTRTFQYLYPRMANNGVYLIEDMHTAYWPRYEGGVRRGGTMIEMAKSLIDELNADWTRGRLEPTAFTRSTTSMHFYDSIIVFERSEHDPAVPVRKGRPRPAVNQPAK